MKTWNASNTENAEYLGTLEIETKAGEFHDFQIMLIRGDRYLFGGACNAGFLESGYMLLENESGELEELQADLETYYNDGPQYVSRIVCNERM